MRWLVFLCCVLAPACARPVLSSDVPPTGRSTPAVTTVALRVHRMAEMVEFYRDAFGVEFEVVDTQGIRSQFGQLGGMTLKLVPLLDSVDFDGYPSHQLGVQVEDVEAVIEHALRLGGRREGEVLRDGERVHAAVRDPDGNTIELYSH